MQYDVGKHCVFYHRYHVVWSTKYRFKVLRGDILHRVREIVRRVCRENEVDIISGVVSADHAHLLFSVPPKLAISDLMRKIKGRSSFLIQREFPILKKRYWGQRFWGKGYFSTSNGAIHCPAGHCKAMAREGPKRWYFSTFKSTSMILPAKAGSCSVFVIFAE